MKQQHGTRKTCPPIISDGRIERQRLRAVAEHHASIHVQRAWRGFKGRRAAFHRATTLAFARETAEGYADPKGFAAANLRTFNAHGGFLGTAGVDALTLLAAAVGPGDEVDRGVMVAKSSRKGGLAATGVAGVVGHGGGVVWLGLKPHGDDDWGLSADARVAGITEVGIRVCLRRCFPSRSVPGGMPPPGGASHSDDFRDATEPPKKQLGFGDDRDIPPLTLKLELISIQRGSWNHKRGRRGSTEEHHRTLAASDAHVGFEQDEESSLVSSESASREDDSSCSSSRRHRSPRGGSDNEINSSSAGSAGSDSGESISDSSEWSKGTFTTIDSSRGSGVDKDKARRRLSGHDSNEEDHRNNLYHQQHLCDVAWCGTAVGGTRAPLVGLPTPRWEGQVFYLPLCSAAASSRVRTAAVLAPNFSADLERQMVLESAHRRGTVGREPGYEHSPPLLAITLSTLSCGTRSRSPRKGRRGSERIEPTPESGQDPWSGFVAGTVDPLPVGRAELEAGDVLSMLGSQQVREMVRDKGEL